MKKAVIIVWIVFCVIGINETFGQETKILNIVASDWPPYIFGEKPGELKGIAKELLEMCVPQTGYDTKFESYPVKRIFAYLEEGKADVSVFSYKKEREDFLFYGKEPLFASGYRPVVLAGKNIQIRTLQDFDKLRLGHLEGLKYSKNFYEYIELRRKKGNLVIATTEDSCLRMLLNNMIDIFVDTQDTTLWRAKEMNALDKIRVLDFDIQTQNYFTVVSKKSKKIKDIPAFLQQTDECLKKVKADGRYDAVIRKYISR